MNRKSFIFPTGCVLTLCLLMGLFSSCDIYYEYIYFDDVYGIPASGSYRRTIRQETGTATTPEAVAQADTVYSEEDPVESDSYTTSSFDYDDYYDYEYSARIRRFHSAPLYDDYYADYYTNTYWYSYDPFYFGTSIYLGYNWWYPSYVYFRPGWYIGFNSFFWDYPYFGFHSPYWSNYYSYWHGYWHGYHDALWWNYYDYCYNPYDHNTYTHGYYGHSGRGNSSATRPTYNSSGSGTSTPHRETGRDHLAIRNPQTFAERYESSVNELKTERETDRTSTPSSMMDKVSSRIDQSSKNYKTTPSSPRTNPNRATTIAPNRVNQQNTSTPTTTTGSSPAYRQVNASARSTRNYTTTPNRTSTPSRSTDSRVESRGNTSTTTPKEYSRPNYGNTRTNSSYTSPNYRNTRTSPTRSSSSSNNRTYNTSSRTNSTSTRTYSTPTRSSNSSSTSTRTNTTTTHSTTTRTTTTRSR